MEAEEVFFGAAFFAGAFFSAANFSGAFFAAALLVTATFSTAHCSTAASTVAEQQEALAVSDDLAFFPTTVDLEEQHSPLRHNSLSALSQCSTSLPAGFPSLSQI
ncbi:MAG: hypothetical protein PHC51_10775 [bacterium]|nr:hypothetical protein [bacterium]